MKTPITNSQKIKYVSEPGPMPPFSNFLELPPIFKIVIVKEDSPPTPPPSETSEKQEVPPSSGK
jgi:hypothetical protein